jgi:hypothetical protein
VLCAVVSLFIYTQFNGTFNQSRPDIPDFVKENENLEFHRETGMIYVNNEVLIFAEQGTMFYMIQRLAEIHNAEISTAMHDIGLYVLRFPRVMTYEEIEKLIETCLIQDFVHIAAFNTVFEVSHDN